ncbi:trafficking protein Mon1 [Ostertagia ostertagi]
MLEIDDTPGGAGSVESSLLDHSMNSSNVPVNQIELGEEETVEPPVSAESVLDRLSKFPYQVFVLSEYGRPIFVSCGHEDQLCSLFALIGVFVSRVKMWGDRLLQLSSGDVHVRFCHRSSLILCIVSRSYELLDDQLNVLFDQIVSTLSRSQLDIVYKKKGDNYDLRRLLRGTDKYMDSSVSAWRTDVSLLQSAIRVLPMQPSDRDYLSSTMVSCLTAAKLDGVLFGLMIAHRQVAAMVRLRRYALHPRDTHILLNLISGNSSLRITEAQTWTPICLPNFNDKGFVYAYISFPWEESAACLILISVKKDHFDPLNEVLSVCCLWIAEGLSSKILKFLGEKEDCGKTREQRLSSFPVSSLLSNLLLHSAYHSIVLVATFCGRLSIKIDLLVKYVYLVPSKVPLISRAERIATRSLYERITHLVREEPHMRCLFLKRSRDNVLVWVTDKFELQCVFSPLVSAVMATTMVDRLLKTLKYHEQRYFIIHTPSF